MFFFVDSAADWIEKVDKNQHPVPIQMDVGGLWELAEIQHFPELLGSVVMEKKLAAVKANLEKYIKTDYCQYLLDLGKKAQYLLINKSPLASIMSIAILLFRFGVQLRCSS